MHTDGGRRKVLFGSNYPMILPGPALADLDQLELDDQARNLHVTDNAVRIFDLK